MRPRRVRPTWKRLVIEYAAMVAAYFVVYYFTRHVWISFIAMLLVLFIGLATRPRGAGPPTTQR